MPEVFEWISLMATWWVIIHIFLPRSGRGKEIRKEMWWSVVYIAYPLAITQIGYDAIFTGSWLARIVGPFWVAMWITEYLYGDHDDRWKKRRKKLAAKVMVKGRRLVVVPTTH